MVLIMGNIELSLCTKNCVKSLTPVMAFSTHNDPLSLEYWIIGCVVDGLKGGMTGVL